MSGRELADLIALPRDALSGRERFRVDLKPRSLRLGHGLEDAAAALHEVDACIVGRIARGERDEGLSAPVTPAPGGSSGVMNSAKANRSVSSTAA